MSTACQVIIDRAKAFSPLNASLATDPTELLTRISQQQQRIFTSVAGVSKDRFQTTQTLTSSSGSSARTVNLESLDLPLERLLVVTVPNGLASQVDVMDLDAELVPRYLVRALTLVEVSNDWSATAGALSVGLTYVYGPTTITVTGATTQTVSLPDAWVDLLIKPLAMYFHTKDPGRDPGEYDRLNAEYQQDWARFVDYLTNYGGVKARRFDIPAPMIADKK